MSKPKNLRMSLKSLRSNQGGFVIIIALGMILILSIFAIIIQQTTINTLTRMKDYENVWHAESYADSGVDYLQWIVNNNGGAGINSGKIVCKYGESANENEVSDKVEGGGQNEFCQVFDTMVESANEGGKTNNIKITAEIKGRASDGKNAKGKLKGVRKAVIATSSGTDEESFSCGAPEFPGGSSCYVVPFPGTGSAGKNCEMYKPDFSDGAKNGAKTQINFANGKIAEPGAPSSEKVNQIDYSCNWNKLTFGSSVTDRATIPLYYTEDDGKTVSPFSGDTTIGGIKPNPYNFVVRVRTPCKPVTNEATKKTVTPTDCKDDKRYILNEKDGDDIVVQWQITGQCKKSANSTEYDEECGMIQFATYKTEGKKISEYFSAINEGRINFGTGEPVSTDLYNYNLSGANDSAHKVLYGILLAIDTSTYAKTRISQDPPAPPKETTKLPTMKNPTLSLFLSGKLISDEGKNVPYLEYQVLTDTPISDSRIRMTVSVNFNGNNYKKTIYKEEQKPLIDFAIQN